ncbi:MAG: hypothetical protein HYW26_05900 [Candidatus Aenigmarchaeota archaeon]|nr:hypothetical protein [Candidatus Aenigmarchaeota archaeon]
MPASEKTSRTSSNKLKRTIASVLIIFLLISVVFLSGCVSQPKTTIKSESEVGEAVTNISGDVEDVSQILTDIDRKLG